MDSPAREHGEFLALIETPFELRQFLFKEKVKRRVFNEQHIQIAYDIGKDIQEICEALGIDIVFAVYEKEDSK